MPSTKREKPTKYKRPIPERKKSDVPSKSKSSGDEASVRKLPRKRAAKTEHVPNHVSSSKGPSKKRARSNYAVPPSKRVKRSPVINTPPPNPLAVFVFGSGEYGELGLGVEERDGIEPTNAERPVRNHLLDACGGGPVQVAAGGMHCAALTRDSHIVTWGVNDKGALGRDTRRVGDEPDDDNDYDLNPRECNPTAIPAQAFGSDIRPFTQVVTADSATFALTADGFVYGWGQFRGADGGIGFSTEVAQEAEKRGEKEATFQLEPMLIPKLEKIKTLAAGENHILALDSKGRVFAWGCGEQYQFGRRLYDWTRLLALTPSHCPVPKKVVSISCGSNHSFAIDESGQVYAWGLNNYSQTGIRNVDENETVIKKPTLVNNLRPFDIQEIQGGNHHSIACTKQGDILVWGRCDDGQIGVPLASLPPENLTLDFKNRPQVLLEPAIILGFSAVSVAAGIDVSMAVSQDGKAYSWGYSGNSRTGLGTEDTVMAPTLLRSWSMNTTKVTFADCGGQFSIIAGLDTVTNHV